MATEIGRINVGNAGYGNNQLYVTYDLLGQNISGNYSTVRAYLYFYAPVWINFSSASAYLHTTGWYGIATSYPAGAHHIGTIDFNVGHNAAGDGSFAIGYGINTSYLVSGSGVTNAVTLPRIPRASEITSFDAFDVEGDIKVSINKKYSGFTDILELFIGSTSIKTISNYTSNTVFQFTDEELNTVFELMTNTNSIDFTAKTTTYNGDDGIGTSSRTAKGNIYNANPLFNKAVFEATNHLDIADNQTIIKGYSNIKVALSAAVAQKKAVISSYKVVCGNSISQSETLLHELTNVDDSVIRCYAVDSRGNTTEVIVNVDKFIQYTPISLDSLSINRNVNGDGTETSLSFSGLLWVGDFGIQENTISAQYCYKELNSTSEWIQGTTNITPTANTNYQQSVDIRGDLGALGFDKSKKYEVKVIVMDKLSIKEKSDELNKFKYSVYIADDGISIANRYDSSITDKNGNPIPFQVWSEALQMMIPITSFALDKDAKFKINGRETSIENEINRRNR